MRLFLQLAFFLLPLLSYASGVSTLKDISGKPWFTIYKTLNPVAQGTHISVIYRDSSLEVLSDEEVIVGKNGAIKSYTWKQIQEQRLVTLNNEAGKWILGVRGKKNKELADSNKVIVVPPLITDYLIKKWNKKEDLTHLQFELLVPDREKIFSFEMNKGKITKNSIEWTLRPTNFFVRMIAGEIDFIFDKNKKLKEIRDFIPPIKFQTSEGKLEGRKTSILFKND